MKISNIKIKKFIIFSQKKAFIIFRKTEIPKGLLMFQETELSYSQDEFLKSQKPNFLIFFQKKL